MGRGSVSFFITQVFPLQANDGKEIRNKEEGEFDQIISPDCQIYSDALTFIYNHSDLLTGLTGTRRAVITAEDAFVK